MNETIQETATTAATEAPTEKGPELEKKVVKTRTRLLKYVCAVLVIGFAAHAVAYFADNTAYGIEAQINYGFFDDAIEADIAASPVAMTRPFRWVALPVSEWKTVHSLVEEKGWTKEEAERVASAMTTRMKILLKS